MADIAPRISKSASIYHDHLLHNIRWLLETLSKNSGKNCIKIDYKNARWVSNANENNTFTIGEILEMISFLVKETYIKAFGHIFQQVKGIIMGGKIFRLALRLLPHGR